MLLEGVAAVEDVKHVERAWANKKGGLASSFKAIIPWQLPNKFLPEDVPTRIQGTRVLQG